MAFGLDPSIALGFKPTEPPPDALEAFQRVQQIQQAQRQAQMAPIQMQQAQAALEHQNFQNQDEQAKAQMAARDVTDNSTFNTEYGKALDSTPKGETFDTQGFFNKLGPKVDIRNLEKYQKTLKEGAETAAKTDTDRRAKVKDIHEQLANHLNSIKEVAKNDNSPTGVAARAAEYAKQAVLLKQSGLDPSNELPPEYPGDQWLNQKDVELRSAQQHNADAEIAQKTADATAKAVADRAKSAVEQRQSARSEFAQKYAAAIANGTVSDQTSHTAFLNDVAASPDFASIKSELGQLKTFDPTKTPIAIRQMARTTKEQDSIDKPDHNVTAGDLAAQAVDPTLSKEKRDAAIKALQMLGEGQTTDYKNYQLSKNEGYKGTFEQWQTQDANRKRPIISGPVIPGLNDNSANAKTGQEFLDTLPFSMQSQVKAISEGRTGIPSANSRAAGAQQLRAAVFQYDKDFSDQRAQARKNAGFGTKEGINIGNMNTSVVHLDQLGEAAKALGNGSFTPGNAVYNSIRETFGSSAPTNFEGLKEAVAGELARGLTGNATVPEIANISQAVASKKSPEQLAKYVDEMMKVVGTKLNTKQEQYSQAVPNDSVYSVVLPSAKAVFDKHGISGKLAGGIPASSGQTAPPLPQTLSASDIGKTYTNSAGKKIKVTDVNPKNNKQFTFDAVDK